MRELYGCELYLKNKNYLKKQKALRFNKLPVMELPEDVQEEEK